MDTLRYLRSLASLLEYLLSNPWSELKAGPRTLKRVLSEDPFWRKESIHWREAGDLLAWIDSRELFVPDALRKRLFVCEVLGEMPNLDKKEKTEEEAREECYERSPRLLNRAKRCSLEEEEAKVCIDIAFRGWLVQVQMGRIGGLSPKTRELKKNLWNACFGQSLNNCFELDHVNRERNVLLLGETGTGKELASEVILSSLPGVWRERRWKSSAREKLSLAETPEGLIAAAIRGYEKGAFTGAVNRTRGLFERAHGGGVFLDEIGDLPYEAQVLLLRVLETGQSQRIGSDEMRPAEVRVVSATNQNLEAGGFRQDLYYRLNAQEIILPPLRERTGDLKPVADRLRKQWFLPGSFEVERIRDWCEREDIAGYDWPGNIREFRRALSCVLLEGDWTPRMEAGAMSSKKSIQKSVSVMESMFQEQKTLEDVISEYAVYCWKRTRHHKSEAASFLNISRGRLDRLIEKAESQTD